ncbi:MAG TPA: LamG-like jellyroll fold domain-containing protein, partial [Myxococcota bacterium]
TDVGVVGRALDLDGSAFAVLDDTTVASQVGAVNPFGLTGGQGSFSFLVGPRVGDAAGMSIGQTIFFADGGDPRSQGFDQRSVHLTIASSTDNGNGPADSIGFSMPTSPARPAALSFVASAAGVIDRNAFNHVLASWSSTGVQLYVNGTLVAEQAITGVAMTLRFIDVGTSQELARVLRGRIDELRASNSTRNAAFARLEARSARGELTQLGTVQNRP